jgi:hypothetical protein
MSELLLNDKSLTTAEIAHPDIAASERAFAQRSDTTAEANSEPAQPAFSTVLAEEPLFPDDELREFRSRWDQAQLSFVDQPREAVKQADTLVANAVKRIAEQFSAEREQLEGQWSSGKDVSTEDLRQALQRYRSFFGRLLAV